MLTPWTHDGTALELLLTGHARGHVGNGAQPLGRDRGPAFRADPVVAGQHPAQRDLQPSRALAQARCAEARQLLMLEVLRDVQEVTAHALGLQHGPPRLKSLGDLVELRLQEAACPNVLYVHALSTTPRAASGTLLSEGRIRRSWGNRLSDHDVSRAMKGGTLMNRALLKTLLTTLILLS